MNDIALHLKNFLNFVVMIIITCTFGALTVAWHYCGLWFVPNLYDHMGEMLTSLGLNTVAISGMLALWAFVYCLVGCADSWYQSRFANK